MVKRLVVVIISGLAVLAALLTLVLVFGGPPPLPPLASINDPFGDVDFSELPPLKPYTARDGARLVFRAYASTPELTKGSVVLIHGSSARSNSLHPLAHSFAQAGYSAYALDVRGHGESGTKGQIAYIGQLEDDLEDFLHAVQPPDKRALLGFSSGGGFALRFAASDRQDMFNRYVLLAPFLHQKSSLDGTTWNPGRAAVSSPGFR